MDYATTLVSILALPFGRALHVIAMILRVNPQFQSSPSLSEGRYLSGIRVHPQTLRFNPRPPFRKGAT